MAPVSIHCLLILYRCNCCTAHNLCSAFCSSTVYKGQKSYECDVKIDVRLITIEVEIICCLDNDSKLTISKKCKI